MISIRLNKIVNVILLMIALAGPWIYAQFLQKNEIQMLQQLITNGSFPITIPISVQFDGDVSFTFPDLIEATQFQIDTELSRLTNTSLNIELLDNFDRKHSSLYSIDLILGSKESLGISATNLKAYIFYTLYSIHSNDLPFVITQTILHHLVRPEIDLMNRPLSENFPSTLDIHLKFDYKKEPLQHNITEFLDDVKQKLVGISVLNWEIHNDVELPVNTTLLVNIPEHNYSTMIFPESDPITEISEIIQDHLNLPQNPKHNIYLKIEAAYKTKTLQLLQEVINKGLPTIETQKSLMSLAYDMISEHNLSWSVYLAKANQLLEELQMAEQ